MVLGACPVAVVRALMVVPGAEPWGCCVGGLEVGIGLVLGMAGAVVAEGDRFGHWGVDAAQGLASLTAVTVNAIFVEVIAEVDHGIEIIPRGDVPVHVEKAERPVRAGHEGECDRRRIAGGGGGLCAAAGRGHAPPEGLNFEFVGVGLAGRQSFGIDLDRIIAVFGGGCLDRVNRPVALLGVEDADGDGDRASARKRGHPGPQDHPVWQGIARCNAMVEGDIAIIGEGCGAAFGLRGRACPSGVARCQSECAAGQA